MRGDIPKGETLAREHLANERTLLSWVRTGGNAISVGILLYFVAEVLGSPPEGLPLESFALGESRIRDFALFGVLLVFFGVFVELIAAARFVQYRRSIGRGVFTPSALVYPLLVLGLFLVGVAYIAYVAIS